MEESVFNGLTLLKYNGTMSSRKAFYDVINDSTLLKSFIELVVWLTNQLKDICGLEEVVSGHTESFMIDVKGFVRELGFPYGEILQVNGLNTSTGRLFLLDFLISELQACHISLSNADDSINELSVRETEGSSTYTCLETITNTLHIPLTPQLPVLFTQIQAQIKELLAKLPTDYLKRPLLTKTLLPKQWEIVSKINEAMCVEYKKRRQVLIKRVDVTIQSFTWSDRLKKSTEDFAEAYQPIRNQLIADSPTSIVDILAARTDLCVIAKTSSGAEREATKCDINRVRIGKVPDRGGRPSSIAPPLEMPMFQQREGGGRGGDRGGYRGHGANSSHSGGRGGGGYGKGEGREYGKSRTEGHDGERSGYREKRDWNGRGKKPYGGVSKQRQDSKMYYS